MTRFTGEWDIRDVADPLALPIDTVWEAKCRRDRASHGLPCMAYRPRDEDEGWLCTRPAGHKGRHSATTTWMGRPQIVAVWSTDRWDSGYLRGVLGYPDDRLPLDLTYRQYLTHHLPLCDATWSGYGCTRVATHTGRHAAGGRLPDSFRVLAVWQ